MGGGNKPQEPQFIQPPPPQIIQAPAPQALPSQTVQETSRQLAQSQLEFNPQLAQQSFEQYQRYYRPTAEIQAQSQMALAPQLARSEAQIAQEVTPLYRAIYERSFPTQTSGLEQLAGQATSQLTSPTGLTAEQQAAQEAARTQAAGRVPSTFQGPLATQALAQYASPTGLTPEQQAAQGAIRDREQERFLRGVRTQANLGGNLYSGNREVQEREGLAELARQYSLQDITLQQQQRQAALQQLMEASRQEQVIAAARQAYGLQDVGLQGQQRAQALQDFITSQQVVFPQIQQPGAPAGFSPQYQSATFSPDALLQALMGQSQNYIVNPAQFVPGTPGSPGAGPDLLKAGIGAAGSIGMAALLA